MKSLGSTKSKLKKDKNGENVPHLEITSVVLIHCNIVKVYLRYKMITSQNVLSEAQV